MLYMKRVLLYWCVLLSCVLFVGCSTDVELCYDVHPHRTLLDFQFQWNEKDAMKKPDSMHVVAIRLVNSIRYDYRVTSHESNNTGVLLYPAEEQVKDTLFDELGNVTDVQDRIWARSGDYQFIAFDSKQYLQTNSGLEDLESGEGGSLYDGLTFSYKTLSLEDCLKHVGLPVWQDFNTYSNYILNDKSSIYYGTVARQTIPMHQSTDNSKVAVKIEPRLITPNIYFVFNVEKESGVVIDSIWGEISGIPETFDFSNGLLSLDKTNKMLFRLNYNELPTYQDSLTVSRLQNTGMISATSIVPSYSQRLTTGPGILNLAVYTHVQTDDGKMKGKVFRVCINLYNTLNQSGLLVWNEQKQTYVQGALNRDYYLRITSPLRIGKDRILNNEDDITLDIWKELGRIDIDI